MPVHTKIDDIDIGEGSTKIDIPLDARHLGIYLRELISDKQRLQSLADRVDHINDNINEQLKSLDKNVLELHKDFEEVVKIFTVAKGIGSILKWIGIVLAPTVLALIAFFQIYYHR